MPELRAKPFPPAVAAALRTGNGQNSPRNQNGRYGLSAGASISPPVQPFQKAWTPKGDVKFTPDRITLFKMKVDMELQPDGIEDSRPGFL